MHVTEFKNSQKEDLQQDEFEQKIQKTSVNFDKAQGQPPNYFQSMGTQQQHMIAQPDRGQFNQAQYNYQDLPNNAQRIRTQSQSQIQHTGNYLHQIQANIKYIQKNQLHQSQGGPGQRNPASEKAEEMENILRDSTIPEEDWKYYLTPPQMWDYSIMSESGLCKGVEVVLVTPTSCIPSWIEGESCDQFRQIRSKLSCVERKKRNREV